MKNIKTMKFWEIIFIGVAILSILPLFLEFLPFVMIPLAVVGIMASIFAFKEKKYYMIAINILILIGLPMLYIYLW